MSKNSQKTAAVRKRRIAKGLCSCGRPPAENRKKCRRCLDRINVSIAKWKQKKVKQNRCRCGGEKVSKTKCQICLDRGSRLGWANFLAALDAYGGRKCTCCGEEILYFLTLDHINNDGWVDRRNGLGGGNLLYARLKKLDYPIGYQVLCYSCNMGKARNNGVCPHQNGAVWNTAQHSRVIELNRQKTSTAIDHYGGVCYCCGESNKFFLTFDHIHNDGNIQRLQNGLTGHRLAAWLVRNDFPFGLIQIACVNCNSGRSRAGGTCPHMV